nr:uncharacterized protein LOC111415566 isoform X2 [Onthophagus taurus]
MISSQFGYALISKPMFSKTFLRNFMVAIKRCDKDMDKDNPKFTLSDLKEMFEIQKQYTLEESPIKDPLFIFQSWYRDAADSVGVLNPSIMCLATSSKTGIPSLRYMFCESFDTKGFRFFTYNTTRKGQDLKTNPYASLCFYWAPLLRSVRVEGPVNVLPSSESDELFNRRAYDMQVNIHCSTQSDRIQSFDVLNERELIVRNKFDPSKVPRPENFCWYNKIKTG